MGNEGVLGATKYTAGAGAKRTPAPRAALKVVHQAVPGRLRVRVGDLHRNQTHCAAVQSQLQQVEGVHVVVANPITGTIKILHCTSLTVEHILNQLSEFLGLSSHRTAVNSCTDTNIKRAIPMAAKAPTAALEGTLTDSEWHYLPTTTVAERLQTSMETGLTTESARERLQRYGRNQLLSAPEQTTLQLILNQLKGWPVALLGASAVVSLATGGIIDAIAIACVVAINAGIGYVTEREGERTIRSLAEAGPRAVTSIRDGAVVNLPHYELVPGDLIHLLPGAYVGADIRILHEHRLMVDESSLTGESLPVKKNAAAQLTADTPLADRDNMVYMGTTVTGGSGYGLVVATGANTEIGAIQRLAGDARAPETPMQRQLDSLGTRLALGSGILCVGVLGVGMLRGFGWLEMLKTSISLAVAAIPEGLPTVATTTLALGIRNMRSHHVAIRQLDAVETLGAVQVFCLDKTGTLTQNHMTVLSISCGLQQLQVHKGTLIDEEGRSIRVHDQVELAKLLEVIALCNESTIAGTGAATTINGSATENALLEVAIAAGLDASALRAEYPLQNIHYRSEEKHYVKTIHTTPERGHLLAIKGSPTQLAALCKFHMVNGVVEPLDDLTRSRLLAINERMASDALRVLAVAYADTDGTRATEDDELIWLGLVGLMDPIRPGIKELMQTFHRAGIETVMITGDQSATAYAIGRQLDLSNGKPLQTLDSSHLEKLDPELLASLAKNVHVFSRVTPTHKLRIVQALQSAGKVVAMTGDGVNDGPALKAANIGVAMGESGTEVACSVAGVVLEDDNLSTMAIAVEQGRTIYQNIRKSVHFLLATNLSEIETMAAGVAFGIGQPLNPMQLLWINLVTDIFPALSLAMEPPELDAMDQPPRDPQEEIVRLSDFKRLAIESSMITAGSMASYLYGVTRFGAGPTAGTMAFTSLTLGQLLHTYSARSEYTSIFNPGSRRANPYLNAAVGVSSALQLLAPYLPPVRALLGLTPLRAPELLISLAGAAVPLLVNEATKSVQLKRAQTPVLPIAQTQRTGVLAGEK